MKRMKRLYNITLILLLLLFASAGASAQIRGVITDSLTHEPLMYITVPVSYTHLTLPTNSLV